MNSQEEMRVEAKARWRNTDVWKQTQERTKYWTKEDYANLKDEGDALMREIVASMAKGAASEQIQKLVAKHYDNLRKFYEPNLELYLGLADMFVADERFAAYFRKFHKDLPEFMREAMSAYCEKKN